MNVKEIDVEGVVLPNLPLSNTQLIDAAKRLNIAGFRGVFLRDALPKKLKSKECGILNLDDSSGRGTHWVAWTQRSNDEMYFDSYGLPPPLELLKYLKSPVYYNSERIHVQSGDEAFCGHLCFHVLKKTSNDGCNFQELINGLH